MAGKRVTMKDIARETGVSTATVSYVLNYSEKEKISHDTRIRVFEAAHKLNYVPNMAARTLAGNKSFLVGIIINMAGKNKKSKVYQYYDLAQEIQKLLYPKRYDVVLIPSKEVENDILIGEKRLLDTVFLMDMEETVFCNVASHFFVPAIFIDGYVEDSLFFKVLTDYEKIMKHACEQLGKEFYVIMEEYSNKYALEIIKKYVPEKDIFINNFESSMKEFLDNHQMQKGLVIGEILGMQAEHYVDNHNLMVVVQGEEESMLLPDTKKIIVSNRKKAEKAVEIMERLLNLSDEEETGHVSYITPVAQ